jgi:hypothetical protein
MARSLGVELLAAISLCAAVPLPLAAQGGWRSWGGRRRRVGGVLIARRAASGRTPIRRSWASFRSA